MQKLEKPMSRLIRQKKSEWAKVMAQKPKSNLIIEHQLPSE
jgi:hypothetical protein